MFKNKKGILILVISLVSIYLLNVIIGIIPIGKKYKNTVFIGESTKVNIKDGKIYIYNEDKKITKQQVKIYFKNSFVDGYVTSDQGKSSGVENSYKLYNTKGDSLILNSIYLFTTPDIKISVKKSTTQEIDNIDTINNILVLNNLTSDVELDYAKIDYLDIDDDKTEEKIYSIGLIKDESDESEEQEYISFVYLEKDGKYVLISKSESDYDGISNVRLSFIKSIDFNNDDKYEIVIERMMSEYGPYYYELYSYGSNKFAKIGGE